MEWKTRLAMGMGRVGSFVGPLAVGSLVVLGRKNP
jgi:hypothetical protein